MIRFIVFIVIYLFVALEIEAGVLPQIESLLSGRYELMIGLRMLALGAVLAGMLRGEVAGMLAGLAGALLAGCSMQAGWLGAGIVSFALIGYLAGLMARHFRLNGFMFRWFTIFFLLVVERLVFIMARWFFWRDSGLVIPWLTLILTGLIGSVIYRLFARALKSNNLYGVDVEA